MTAIDLGSPFGPVEMGSNPSEYQEWFEATSNGSSFEPSEVGIFETPENRIRRIGSYALGDPELMVTPDSPSNNF